MKSAGFSKEGATLANDEESSNKEDIYQNLQGPPPPVRSVSLPEYHYIVDHDQKQEYQEQWVTVTKTQWGDPPSIAINLSQQQPPRRDNRPRTATVDYRSINDQSRMRMRQQSMENSNKEEDRYTSSRIIFQHVTTGVHVCTLLYTILVVYLCFSQEFNFFAWHPLLLSIGWCFLMTEGILALSKENFLSGTLPRPTRVLWHWSLQGMAVLLLIGGFFVVYVNKSNLNKEHFKTWHGLLGLIATILAIITACAGIAASYRLELMRFWFRPRLRTALHVILGIATYSVGGATLFLSVYTKWFERRTEGNAIVARFGMAMVGISIVWTLARPLIGLRRRLM